MLVKLLITIDTEPDCDTHWNRSNPLTFTSVTEGIPRFLRPIWNETGVEPIYFVSPEVVKNEECCRILKNEIKMGATIGTHLHSEFIAPNEMEPAGKAAAEFPCNAHAPEVEFQKIKNLTELIEKNLSVKPIWYRAGRFGANIHTIRSLVKLGYLYDSSVTPCLNWKKQGGQDFRMAPLEPYWISKEDISVASADKKSSVGIQEFPVTVIGRRFGLIGSFLPENWLFYSWLRPTHMFLWELKGVVSQIFKIKKINEAYVFNMMFHSMEIMPMKSPYIRTRIGQAYFLRKLKKSIEYIKLRSEN